MNIKKFSLACLLPLTTFSAVAANSVDLTVKGTLVTGICTPNLSNNGVVDFGTMSLADLSKTETNQLGSKEITLTITCDSSIPVSWNTVDNRRDSVSVPGLMIENVGVQGLNVSTDGNHFGLGKTAGGVNIGSYTIAALYDNATADGGPIDLLSKDWTDKWVRTASGLQRSDGGWLFTSATPSSLNPVAAQTYVYPLQIAAAIQGTDVLNITDDTSLDGSATISLVYL
ncbi:DUF1120 domain-containing protein [Enterobacter ludwigii]